MTKGGAILTTPPGVLAETCERYSESFVLAKALKRSNLSNCLLVTMNLWLGFTINTSYFEILSHKIILENLVNSNR